EMLHCLKDVSPSLIIAEDVKFETQILDLKERVNTQIISFGSFFEKAQTISLEDFDPDFKIEKEQPIFIFFTSGSTGKPKGVIYTNQMMLWNNLNTAIQLEITSA
ncbi:AMP-binding protein, partial [Aquimarina celericrescens]|nr:AMP-binding protein [Aquimarina celericrescens]